MVCSRSFLGYDAKVVDLPPRAICAKLWRARILVISEGVGVMVLRGGDAMAYHLRGVCSVAAMMKKSPEYGAVEIKVKHV